MPGLPPAPVLSALIERLRLALSTALLPELDDGAVSGSIGVAWYPGDGDTADVLLGAADRAMYGVKEGRRAKRGPPADADFEPAVAAAGGGRA